MLIHSLAPRRMTREAIVISNGVGNDPDQLPADGILVVKPEDPCHVLFMGAFTYNLKGIRYVDEDGNAYAHDKMGLYEFLITVHAAPTVTVEALAAGVPDGQKLDHRVGGSVTLSAGSRGTIMYCPAPGDYAWWLLAWT